MHDDENPDLFVKDSEVHIKWESCNRAAPDILFDDCHSCGLFNDALDCTIDGRKEACAEPRLPVLVELSLCDQLVLRLAVVDYLHPIVRRAFAITSSWGMPLTRPEDISASRRSAS